MNDKLTIEVVRELVRYEPDTGRLFWKERSLDYFGNASDKQCARNHATWNKKFAGKETFLNKDKHGYLRATLFNRPEMAHRVAWAIVYGEWSNYTRQIDHINRNPCDNRIQNLRMVTGPENIANRERTSYKYGGERGISFNPASGKWQASVPIGNGKSKYLGSFEDIHEARIARDAAAKVVHALSGMAA